MAKDEKKPTDVSTAPAARTSGVQPGDKVTYVDGNGEAIPAQVTFVFNLGEDETHPTVHLQQLNPKGKPSGIVRSSVVHESSHPEAKNCWK